MARPVRTVVADRGDAGRRLDVILVRYLADVNGVSRTRIQSWIESGHVTVNGRGVRRVATRSRLGDVVAIVLPPVAPRLAMAAEALGLDVLYEDRTLLAINKPAGLVVHPTYGHTRGTIMNGLLWHARGWPDGQRPSLVQRLDKLTSGVIVVAKTSGIHAALQRTMASSLCEKDYLTVVYGRVNRARGTIDLRLSRDASDRRRVVASTTTGAECLTRFERLGRVAAPRAGLSLLQCRLTTGRMHQIRVHLTARGWPIVGDPKYGQPLWSRVGDPALAGLLKAFPRQALHAWRVILTHPVTGRRLSLEAPLPSDFETLLDAAGLRSFCPAGRSTG